LSTNPATPDYRDLPDRLCLGCGACAGICPGRAIELVESVRGVYRLKIDKAKCTCCGLCVKVCPAQTIDLPNLYRTVWGGTHEALHRRPVVEAGYGWASDDALHRDSQSGGLVTGLLGYMLDNGLADRAVVAKPCAANPFKGQVVIVRGRQELSGASRSVYSQVPMASVIRDLLDTQGRTAFVGLPCHIQALRQAEAANARLRSRIAIHLGLFCAGVMADGIHNHLARIGRVRKRDVAQFRYRGHRYRGYPGDSEFDMSDGRGFYVDRRYRQAVRGLYLPRRCFYCWDKLAALADVCCGDPWGGKIEEKEGKVTAYIVRNGECVSLLRNAQASGYVETRATDCEWILAGQRMEEVQRSLGCRLRLARTLRVTAPGYLGFAPDRKITLADVIETFWMSFNTSSFGAVLWKAFAGRPAMLACKILAMVLAKSRRRIEF